jgi:uncharacterized protein YeaO (DUF488 family)
MKPKLQTYQIGTPREIGEGLRIGTVRFLPRGVKKADYAKLDLFDVWLPTLAPSRELLKEFTSGKKTALQFFRAYRAEMKLPAAKYTIRLLAKIAEKTPLAVGCYCENETRCHRSVLIELLRAAAES